MSTNNENPDVTIGEAQPLMDALSEDHCNSDTVNEARAKSGWLALLSYTEKVYGGSSDEPAEQGIRDLLGDLQHTCNHLGLDFNELLERATTTFSEELQSPLG